MAKYYVESGDLKVVVQASSPIPAAAKALSWATEEDRLEDTVTISQRGFASGRNSRVADESRTTVETGTLLALIAEHEIG